MEHTQLAFLVPSSAQTARVLTGVYGTLDSETPRNDDGSYNFIVDGDLAKGSSLLAAMAEAPFIVAENDLVTMDNIRTEILAGIKATFASALRNKWSGQYDAMINTMDEDSLLIRVAKQERKQALAATTHIIETSNTQPINYTVLNVAGFIEGDLDNTIIVPFQDESDYDPIDASNAIPLDAVMKQVAEQDGVQEEFERFDASVDDDGEGSGYALSDIDADAKAFVYHFGQMPVYFNPASEEDNPSFYFRFALLEASPKLLDFMVMHSAHFNPKGIAVNLEEAAHLTQMDTSNARFSDYLNDANRAKQETQRLMSQMSQS